METELHPLRKWRADNDVTLAALAGAVAVTASHLSEIERKLDKPSFELTQRLCKHTGLPAAEIAPDLADKFREMFGVAAE